MNPFSSSNPQNVQQQAKNDSSSSAIPTTLVNQINQTNHKVFGSKFLTILFIIVFILIIFIGYGLIVLINKPAKDINQNDLQPTNQDNQVEGVVNTLFDLEKASWTKVDNSSPKISDNLTNNGRIAIGKPGTGDAKSITNGSIIKDGNIYKIWYSALSAEGFNKTRMIYYAFSFDGLNWIKYDNSIPENTNTTSTNGRLGLGLSGTGDDTELANPKVLKVKDKYYMWYVAKGSGTGDSREYKYQVYLATSDDGLTWTKVNNSIAERSDSISYNGRIPLGNIGTGDENGISGVEVLYKDDEFKMWYTADGRIYYAKSFDGLEWTKIDNSIPEDSNFASTNGRIGKGLTGMGDENGVSLQVVYYTNNKYYGIYAGDSKSTTISKALYCITSPDGLTWNKVNNSLPSELTDTVTSDCRLTRGLNGTGDKVASNAPNAIDIVFNGDTAYLYYLGVNDSNSRQIFMVKSN